MKWLCQHSLSNSSSTRLDTEGSMRDAVRVSRLGQTYTYLYQVERQCQFEH